MLTVMPFSEQCDLKEPCLKQGSSFLRDLLDRIKKFIKKLFIACIFPLYAAIHGDRFTRKVVSVYKGCSWKPEGTVCCIPPTISLSRMQESLKYFKRLGGTVGYVRSKGVEDICYFHVTAKQFETKIESYGGAWKEIELDEQKCLAIIPPDEPNRAWEAFSENCLSKFGWETAYYEGKWVFVTARGCNLANKRRCFIYNHTFVTSFTTERRMAGVYLGMKADLCMYDYRGTFMSTGEPSMEGCYSDSEAVLDKMLEQYYPKEIWAVGKCLAGIVTTHQKAHCPGINLCVANMPFSFHEDTNRRIIKLLLDLVPSMRFKVDWDSLKDEESKPGKVVAITTDTDTFISDGAVHKLEIAARTRGFPFKHIVFEGPEGRNGHFLEPMLNDRCRWDFVTNSVLVD